VLEDLGAERFHHAAPHKGIIRLLPKEFDAIESLLSEALERTSG